MATSNRDRLVVTTSWDDGRVEDVRMSRLLLEHGLTGTFYASTGPEGQRKIDDGGLEEIGAHHELGVHGRTHRSFPRLSPEEIADEIAWGYEHLLNFGNVCRIVAPPFGHTNGRVNEVILSEGYAVRTAPVIAPGAASDDGILEPSFQYYPHSPLAALRNAVRRTRLPQLDLFVALFSRRWRDRVETFVERVASNGSPLHVWGHSDEIDRLGLWTQLSDLFEFIGRFEHEPRTNGELLPPDETHG